MYGRVKNGDFVKVIRVRPGTPKYVHLVASDDESIPPIEPDIVIEEHWLRVTNRYAQTVQVQLPDGKPYDIPLADIREWMPVSH